MTKVKQEKIQQHYDAFSDKYDHHYDHAKGRCYHIHVSRHLMEMLPNRGFLLDIGCGTGLFLDRYVAEGGAAVGIDISRGMIRQARRRCMQTDFTVGTGENLPFADDSFDAVSCLLAFSYMKDPQGMLNEACRVLKPGGSIAICTLGKKLLTCGIPALYQIGDMMRVNHLLIRNFGEHYFNEEEMLGLFGSAGFVDLETNWCSFAHRDLIAPLFKFAQKVEPFVERRLPQLAYNICVKGRKPS